MRSVVIRVSNDVLKELKVKFPGESVENSIRIAVGMPKVRIGRKYKYQLHELDVGDTAQIKCDDAGSYNLVYQAMLRTQKKFKMKFSRSFAGGIAKITRIA